MRCYIPSTFDDLYALDDSGTLRVPGGWGFAATPALRDFYSAGGDDEELEDIAFEDASRASLRLLTNDVEHFPHRRVVVAVEVPDHDCAFEPDMGESVVKLSTRELPFEAVASLHVDVASNEEATKRAISVIDAADLEDQDAELTVGDCLEHLLAWYYPSELSLLTSVDYASSGVESGGPDANQGDDAATSTGQTGCSDDAGDEERQ